MPHEGPPDENRGRARGEGGAPVPTPGTPDEKTLKQVPPLERLPRREAQKEAGEVAERSAGTRRAELDEEDPTRGEK